MKFLDETVISVTAGRGGSGCVSFRREKYVPHGGPDGGNGGKGGSVYLRASAALNTLVRFQICPLFSADNGQPGAGRGRCGKQGADRIIDAPIGTTVFSADTEELIGDLLQQGQLLLVAAGGRNGVGNTCFESSTNRAPRECTSGEPGEARRLRPSLRVLADVGLVGLPNAGKSSLIRAISSATPKIADYPFTTLKPHLGVVSVGVHDGFVVADVPGLIAGAAQGAGLGIQFLKHLERTRLLLHVIDVQPVDGSDPVTNAVIIQKELSQHSKLLSKKPRWIVLNKIDLFPEKTCRDYCDALIEKLQIVLANSPKKPIHLISATTREGTTRLCERVAHFLSTTKPEYTASD